MGAPAVKPLFARLRHYSHLTEEDFAPLARFEIELTQKPKGAVLIEVGAPVRHVFVIVQGWAMRTRALDDGGRQIVNIMLPGDCFDLQAMIDTGADHGVEAITPVSLYRMQRDEFLNAIRSSGRLATAFWWAAIQEESILREQIVRLGRRSGRQRIAHLLLELHRRLNLAGVAQSASFDFPLTRELLADLLGLSPVHVSRSLSALKRMGLIRVSDGAVNLLDRRKLADFAGFDAGYLHIGEAVSSANPGQA